MARRVQGYDRARAVRDGRATTDVPHNREGGPAIVGVAGEGPPHKERQIAQPTRKPGNWSHTLDDTRTRRLGTVACNAKGSDMSVAEDLQMGAKNCCH